MTHLTLKTYRDAYEIKAEGHATGSVEVCAAISTIMTALADWAFRKGYREDQVLEPGHACVVIPRAISGSRAVFDLATAAFELLAENAENFCDLVQNLGQESFFRLLS